MLARKNEWRSYSVNKKKFKLEPSQSFFSNST